MEFNKVVRGNKRAIEDEQIVFDILDAGYLCHVSFVHHGQPMCIPTAFGRDGDTLYLHGSTKNFMLNAILASGTACISVTHLDGLVLARSLFDTGVNYRSVVIHGTPQLVTDKAERMHGLEVFTNHILPGRWQEVPVGTPNQFDATMVIKVQIERVGCKVRTGPPVGDELLSNEIWSGVIPYTTSLQPPLQDTKFGTQPPLAESVQRLYAKQ
ncbi:MAG: hypothetical protein RL660_356 [Bacteroidota bacterium]|jgi:nitroimidazol reductase NimA-like FMN-containing flavoprotein (pyridoxamine 5'-phosphate oxidase superfamily)